MNRRLLFTLSPVLLFLGIFIHPEEPQSGRALFEVLHRHPTQWLTAHLLLLAGITVFVPVVLALAEAVRATAPRLSRLVAVLGVAGCGTAAGIFGSSVVLTSVADGAPAEMGRLLQRVIDARVDIGAQVFVLGMLIAIIVAAAVLVAAGRITAVAGILTAAGFVASVLVPEPFACIGAGLTIVGLTMAARQLPDADRQLRSLHREPARV